MCCLSIELLLEDQVENVYVDDVETELEDRS